METVVTTTPRGCWCYQDGHHQKDKCNDLHQILLSELCDPEDGVGRVGRREDEGERASSHGLSTAEVVD